MLSQMVREGVCCGDDVARSSTCVQWGILREGVPVSVQPFLALLASSYGARQSMLASDQTQSGWQEGSVTLISPRGIHLSVNGRLWGRSGRSKCLARLQGQMFFSAICPDRKGRSGGLLEYV